MQRYEKRCFARLLAAMKSRHSRLTLLICVAMLSSGGIADAQDISKSPLKMTLPDLSTATDPKVIADGWKYFYFYKSGVSTRQAQTDFTECYAFLGTANYARLPTFAAWPNSPSAGNSSRVDAFGVAGAILADMVSDTLQRRNRQSKMRRCMEPRGYRKYAVSKQNWELLIGGDQEAAIVRQAELASGYNPDERTFIQ